MLENTRDWLRATWVRQSGPSATLVVCGGRVQNAVAAQPSCAVMSSTAPCLSHVHAFSDEVEHQWSLRPLAQQESSILWLRKNTLQNRTACVHGNGVLRRMRCGEGCDHPGRMVCGAKSRSAFVSAATKGHHLLDLRSGMTFFKAILRGPRARNWSRRFSGIVGARV